MISFFVVLVEPEFESTIGLVARAMKNFGLRDLRLVTPIANISREARMRASHAQDILDTTRVYSSLSAAIAQADQSVGTTAQRAYSFYKISRKPVTPRELMENLAGLTGSVALVFGREGTGLNNKELGLCDLALTIPASPKYSTLNISHAAAIIFYELYASAWKTPGDVLAGAEVKQRILDFVEQASDSSDVRNKVLVAKAFRTLMARSSIRAREASLLAGFFRKVVTQLDGKPAEESGGTHVPKNEIVVADRSPIQTGSLLDDIRVKST